MSLSLIKGICNTEVFLFAPDRVQGNYAAILLTLAVNQLTFFVSGLTNFAVIKVGLQNGVTFEMAIIDKALN